MLAAIPVRLNVSFSKRFAPKKMCFLSTFISFTTKITVEGKSYMYVFQVCGDADGLKNAGVVQRDDTGKQVRIGSYNSTQAFGGSKWQRVKHINTTQMQIWCRLTSMNPWIHEESMNSYTMIDKLDIRFVY